MAANSTPIDVTTRVATTKPVRPDRTLSLARMDSWISHTTPIGVRRIDASASARAIPEIGMASASYRPGRYGSDIAANTARGAAKIQAKYFISIYHYLAYMCSSVTGKPNSGHVYLVEKR